MLRTCWAPTSVRALLPPWACSFRITFAAWPRSCSLLAAKAVAQTSSCSNILNAPHINLVHVRACTPELARRGAEVLEAAIAHRTRPITLSDHAICSCACAAGPLHERPAGGRMRRPFQRYKSSIVCRHLRAISADPTVLPRLIGAGLTAKVSLLAATASQRCLRVALAASTSNKD